MVGLPTTMASTALEDILVQDLPDLPKKPEDQKRTYEDLKSSVAALRSKIHSAPVSRTRPLWPSTPTNDLAPYAKYFGKSLSKTIPVADNSHQRQVEASGLLESYAMQALRIDYEIKLKESQKEMEKIREKLQDKIRRTESFDRDMERQRRKLEAKISFYSDQSKLLERKLSEEATQHSKELQLRSAAYKESLHQYGGKKEQEISKLIATYEDSVETLRKTNEAQTTEIAKLENEYKGRLQEMERSKANADNLLKHLEDQMKLVAKQAEKFQTNYDEQEKLWNVKLQHITSMHQFQIQSLRQEHEVQITTVREECERDKEEQKIKFQDYRTQKLKDMEYMEERVKEVVETKEATICQLRLQLEKLHRMLLSSNFLQEEEDVKSPKSDQ